MTNQEIQQYKDFMSNPCNSLKCEGCPANEGCSAWQGRLPCGQWNCWVDCHCGDD